MINNIKAAFALDVGVQEKLVCLTLVHLRAKNGSCTPTMKELAAKASVSPRTAFRIIVRLEKNGLIKRKERRGNDGGRLSNQYDLLFITTEGNG